MTTLRPDIFKEAYEHAAQMQAQRIEAERKDRLRFELLNLMMKCLQVVTFDFRERGAKFEPERAAKISAELAGRMTVHAGRMTGTLDEASIETMKRAFAELDIIMSGDEVVQ